MYSQLHNRVIKQGNLKYFSCTSMLGHSILKAIKITQRQKFEWEDLTQKRKKGMIFVNIPLVHSKKKKKIQKVSDVRWGLTKELTFPRDEGKAAQPSAQDTILTLSAFALMKLRAAAHCCCCCSCCCCCCASWLYRRPLTTAVGNWPVRRGWRGICCKRAFFKARWLRPFMSSWSFKCWGGWKYLQGGFSRLHLP